MQFYWPVSAVSREIREDIAKVDHGGWSGEWLEARLRVLRVSAAGVE